MNMPEMTVKPIKASRNGGYGAAVLIAGLSVGLGAAADVVTNSWIGADGGSWGTADNWSARHVPDGTEYVTFPDKGASYSVYVEGDYEVGCFHVDSRASGTVELTLLGSGRIKSNGTEYNYVRDNRRLVLESGVTLDLSSPGGTKMLMLYNGLVVKAGATNLVDNLQLHWRNSSVSLQGGCLNVSGNTTYREWNNTIRVEAGGIYSSTDLKPSSSASNPGLAFVQDGGSSMIANVVLSESSSLVMNGGLLQFQGMPLIAAAATLNFNGGTNEFAAAVTDGALARRFLCGNENTTVKVTATGSKSLLLDESCTITAPLEVKSGGIYFTNAVTVASVHPVFANTLYNGAASAGNIPTIRFPAVILNSGAPFTTDGKTRQFYVEGPMTFRSIGNQTTRASKAPYPFLTGDIAIDTRDWYDESVTHTLTMELGPRDDAAITVRGGGAVKLAQQCSAQTSHIFYRSVTVEEGTTLSLVAIGGTTDGRLRTDKFVLGPNTTLNLDMSKASDASEYNAVIAGKFEIDPTATINVTVPADFTSGAIPILVEEGSDSIADYSSQITYSGETTGFSFVRTGGSLMAVKKTVYAPDGTYTYEWTGGGTSDGWADADNWSANAVPPEKKTIAFGAADVKTASIFDAFSGGGSTAGTLLFRDTAVSSFNVSGKQMTFSNRDADGGTGASICSYSAMPQFVGLNARSTDNISFSSHGGGPIVFSGGFSSKSANKIMYVRGGIHCHHGTVSENNRRWPKLQLQSAVEARDRTCFALMDGEMTFTNQTDSLSVAQTSLRVAEGATLTFMGTALSKYQWTAEPRRIVVDGTLDVQSPFMGGGVRQIYGGDGTIRIASLQPSTGATSVEIGDTLTVDAPASWPTVASGADTPLTLAARSGRPVIHATNGWTYGPAEGSSPTTTPAERAAFIRPEATLAVEPGGGVATFVDPVAGSGTLEITNGTLRVEGGISPETRLAVAPDGAFECGSPASFAGLSVAEGGTLLFSDLVVATVADDVSLSGVRLRVSESLFAGRTGWMRLLVAKSISGAPRLPNSNWKSRVVRLDDGTDAFEVCAGFGMVVILR